jgi:hypothetical protein
MIKLQRQVDSLSKILQMMVCSWEGGVDLLKGGVPGIDLEYAHGEPPEEQVDGWAQLAGMDEQE